MKITSRRGVKKTKKSHDLNKNQKHYKWLILFGLLIAALYFYQDSLHEIMEGIKALSAVQMGVSLLLSSVFFLTEGYIVYCMAHLFESSYRWRKGIRTAYVCEFYRMLTLGSGAGFAEIYYLQKDNVPYPRGTGMTMLQFVIKKIAVMLLGLAGFLFLLGRDSTSNVLHGYEGAMGAGCIITFVIVFAMTAVTLSKTVRDWLLPVLDKLELKFPKYQEKIQKWREDLKLLNDTGRELFARKKCFLQVILLNLCKLLSVYLIPAYVLYGQCPLSIMESTMLMAVIYMLAGVIPAPSGIGSLEFVFLLFFSCFVSEAAAVPAILVFRFATWIVPFLVGGIIFLHHQK